MWRLHHFELCPFSRKVRLLLSEKGVAYALHPIVPWECRDELRHLNRAGRTPVLQDPDRRIVLADSAAICEYIEQTVPGGSLLMGSAEQRAETRRLVAWADELFYAQVTLPLLRHRLIENRHEPDERVLNAARSKADVLLEEIGFLVDTRAWLAGPTLSMADLATAAHISVADYLGGINWAGHEQAQTWYSVIKSRRSFQPLLAERVMGIEPPAQYSDLNA